MIRVDKGVIAVSGMKVILMAELTSLIESLKENANFDDDDIETCVKTASMSEDELQEAIDKGLKELEEDIKNIKNMEKLIKTLFEEE